MRREKEECVMKKLLLAATAAAALVAAVPASAQFYVGANPGGVGVQVGPIGAGVGPRYGWRERHWREGYRAYGAADCRVIRERIETPSGRLIIKSRRVCY
jgi:hypothetical protein